MMLCSKTSPQAQSHKLLLFYLFDNLSIDNIQTLKDERWFKEYDSDVIATESVAITI